MIASTTAAQLHRCLSGIRFPASKEDLLAAAIANSCDGGTVDALRDISAVTYANPQQVLASVTIVDTPSCETGAAHGHHHEAADDLRS
jgi:hypothetical protein